MRTFAVVIVLASLAVRLPGLFHDFWLDEAWSYLLVRDLVKSPADILTRYHLDNNHPLNSLVLYLLGGSTNWPLYRIPALLAGAASVALAGLYLSRFGRPHAVCGLVLTGFSFPLIVYSTEARGYAPLILFTLLALIAADRLLTDRFGRASQGPAPDRVPAERREERWHRREWCHMALLWGAVIFGFLSHLTFIHCYAALLVWTAFEALESRGRWSDVWKLLARWHLVPLLLLLAYVLVHVRHLSIGGAAPRPLVQALVETAALAIGTPDRGVLALVAVPTAVVVLLLGLAEVRRTRYGLFLFFLCGIIAVPFVMILLAGVVSGTVTYFPRYFLVSLTLFLLLASYWLGECWRENRVGQAVCVLALLLFCAGNASETVKFMRYGRGQYRAAVAYLLDQTADPVVRVAGSSDFRTRLLLFFHTREPAGGREFAWYPDGPLHADVEWCIVESLESRARVPAAFKTQTGNRFHLVRYFPFYGPSGSGWSIYRRMPDVKGDEQDAPPPDAKPEAEAPPGDIESSSE